MTTAAADLTESTLATWELAEIQRANDSKLTPVVFVHGLWLLSSSWKPWRDFFEQRGFMTLAPGWPDDPDTIEEAKSHPEVFAHKMVQGVADHYVAAIQRLDKRPAIIGHSFGGLLVQKIADAGVAAASVVIDNAPIRGVLPLPISALKSASPVLRNPTNIGKSVSLTFEQFTYAWANNLDAEEARRLYDTFHVPASGAPLFQAAFANLNPFGGETKVDVKNPKRGPMLFIAGTKDHTAPIAFVHGSYKLQLKNQSPTEYVEIPDRGHSLVIDHGWRDVAEPALAFIKQFT